MKSYFVIVALSILVLSCSGSNITSGNMRSFTIDFQNHFDQDVISLRINGCLIFDKKIVSSIENIGFAELRVVVEPVQGSFIATIEGEEVRCNNNQKVELEVTLNGHRHIYRVDLSQGVHLGFNNLDSATMHFRQSQFPFIYL